MNCGLRYNSNLPFSEQSIEAWGMGQVIDKGDPYYKESNLNASNFVFFSRLKSAFDVAYKEFEDMFKYEYNSENTCREFKERLAQRVCDTLYFLIDDQRADY